MATKTNFRGSLTALVTPFKNGSLDEAGLRELVNWQIEQDRTAVPVGTTGESPTSAMKSTTRSPSGASPKRRAVPVIAGAGSNSTREAIAPRSTPKGGR